MQPITVNLIMFTIIFSIGRTFLVTVKNIFDHMNDPESVGNTCRGDVVNTCRGDVVNTCRGDVVGCSQSLHSSACPILVRTYAYVSRDFVSQDLWLQDLCFQ